MPMHEADDDARLRPRLLALSAPAITHALAAMVQQHQAIDDLIERVVPILMLVANNPAKLPQAHGELCTISKALTEIFQGHLELEEGVIFPAVLQKLSAASQEGLLQEMQERRKQG